MCMCVCLVEVHYKGKAEEADCVREKKQSGCRGSPCER